MLPPNYNSASLWLCWRPSVRCDPFRKRRHALRRFASPDVLRFLGKKPTAVGEVNGNVAAEVTSDLKRRQEGVRIKHRAGKNMVKMYNKEPTLLRVETTLNDGQGLKG